MSAAAPMAAARWAARWLLPAGVADVARRLLRPAPERPEGLPATVTAANAALKNRHAGGRCFICATGPSIKTQDLSGLAGEIVIGVSHFFLHDDIERIAPTYHVIAPYHPPFDFDAVGKLFDGFAERYGDQVTYIVGDRPYAYSVRNFLEARPEHRKEAMYFVDYAGADQLEADNRRRPELWDLTASPFEPRTVIYIAIQAAAYMGFKEIVLLGCDHDYLHDTSRVSNHHFYKEEEGVSDVAHLSAFTTERWFKEYYDRWRQYRLMRETLAERGVTIVNATAGGMLDVFPRADLQAVLGDRRAAHVR